MPTWTGAVSTDWNTAGNWVSPSAVPTSTTDAIFDATSILPCTTGNTARNCRDLITTGHTGTLQIGSTTAGFLNVHRNATIGGTNITGSSDLTLINIPIGGVTLDVQAGTLIPNFRTSAFVINAPVTLVRTTVVTNYTAAESASGAMTRFISSTVGTELRINNYVVHHGGATNRTTAMGTNTTLRLMGGTFCSFAISGSVVLNSGATITPLQLNDGATIVFSNGGTFDISAGTLTLPAISNTNRLGTGFSILSAITLNMGANTIDHVSLSTSGTITLQSDLVINKAINQGIFIPVFSGGFNVIVKESLGTRSFANYYGLYVTSPGKLIYQSSSNGFKGLGYISGTTVFITSVIQGVLGNHSIIHVPSSSTTNFGTITGCTILNQQYSIISAASMNVGSIGSPVQIFGFGIGALGLGPTLLEIDAGSNDVYFVGGIGMGNSPSELRYLSSNTGIFDGSKMIISGGGTGFIDFQGLSSPTKFIGNYQATNLTLKQNIYVRDVGLGPYNLSQTGGSYTFYVLRNYIGNGTYTPTIELTGSEAANFTCAQLNGNININKSTGTVVTVVQSFSYGYATPTTFTYTSGVVNFGLTTITMTVTGNCTIVNPLSVGNFSFRNITVGSFTVTITNLLTVTGSLTSTGSSTFAGTHGFTCQNFTCTTPASIITLQNITANPLAEYRVNGVLTILGTLANRVILQSAGFAAFNGTITPVGQLNYLSGTVPQVGMTLSQATGFSPTQLNPSNRSVITGGVSPTFTITPPANAIIGSSLAMRAGYKAKFTLTNNGTSSQNVTYAQTQDIDSSAGVTILSFGSNGDDVNNSTIALFRTLNWGPLVAPSGSVYYTFVS
jgi:hypothetical protein